MDTFKTVLNGRVLRVSAAFLVAATTLFSAACSGPTEPDEADLGPGGTGQIYYTAVGASDAIAIGASVSCLPFIECPAGTGYVQLLNRQLAEGGRSVRLLNLGIPGAVLSPRIETISHSYGPRVDFNFLERELPFVSRDSTVVTIFAGGNDTNVVARSVSGRPTATPRASSADRFRKLPTELAPRSTGFPT